MCATATYPIWTTVDGTKIPIKDLEDQHLSNIYWFSRVFYGQVWQLITDEVVRRFGHVANVLKWKPLPVPNEIAELRRRGHILGNAIVMPVGGKTPKMMVIGSIAHIPPEIMKKSLDKSN